MLLPGASGGVDVGGEFEIIGETNRHGLARFKELAAPAVVTQPADVTVDPGQTAGFTVAFSGNTAPTVQWQQSNDGGATFQDVAGATAATLSVPNVGEADNGRRYRAVGTNSVGSATSNVATLTVNKPAGPGPDPEPDPTPTPGPAPTADPDPDADATSDAAARDHQIHPVCAQVGGGQGARVDLVADGQGTRRHHVQLLLEQAGIARLHLRHQGNRAQVRPQVRRPDASQPQEREVHAHQDSRDAAADGQGGDEQGPLPGRAQSKTKRLKPGKYTVTLVAKDSAGQSSVPRSLSFTVAAR